MRSVQQPGVALSPRIIACPVETKKISLDLPAGRNFLTSIADAVAVHGYESAVLRLQDIPLSPMAYVMPALSKTGENAAFYSDIFRPSGVTRIEHGAMTLGQRDGAPFFHCHALWREADGKRSGGHILPEETSLAADVTVAALAIKGARFEGAYDPETNFKLFGPVATVGNLENPRAYAIRLRPNQDFCLALEEFCAAHNIRRAAIHGGVGSTIGARFADGRCSEPFATEVFIRDGKIAAVNGPDETKISVGLVDYTGGMTEGILARGDNPVLMTFELVLVADDA